MAKHMHKLCDKSSGSQTFPQDIYDRKFTGDADVDPIGGRKRPGFIALSREGHGRPTLGLGRYLYYIMFKQPAMPRPQALDVHRSVSLCFGPQNFWFLQPSNKREASQQS